MFADCILGEAEVRDLLKTIGQQGKTVQDLLTEVREKFGHKEFLFLKALASLITSGLLNRPQRVMALIILTKMNIQKINPFFGVLDQIFQQKELLVESNLVLSLLCEISVPNELMKRSVKEIIEHYNKSMFFDQPKHLIEQRKAYADVSDDIRRNSCVSNELPHVLADGSTANTRTILPTEVLRYEDLKEQDLEVAGFKARNLIPLPSEVPISEEEACWLYPLASDSMPFAQSLDGQEMEKVFAELIKKATEEKLSVKEKNLVFELLTDHIDYLARNNILFDKYLSMVNKANEDIVYFSLCLFHDKHNSLFAKMIQTLLLRSSECEWRDLSIVSWLVKMFDLPDNFIEGFILGWWKGIEALRESSSDYLVKAKLICKLILTLVEKKVIDLRQPHPWYEYLKSLQFMDSKSSHNPMDDLSKLIVKINSCQENKNSEGH